MVVENDTTEYSVTGCYQVSNPYGSVLYFNTAESSAGSCGTAGECICGAVLARRTSRLLAPSSVTNACPRECVDKAGGEDGSRAWCDNKFIEAGYSLKFCKDASATGALEALEKCCECGGGVQEEIVDTVLCGYFGGFLAGNWWEEQEDGNVFVGGTGGEGWTESNWTVFQQYQEEIQDLTHREQQQQWCDGPVSDRWNLNGGAMAYNHEEEWSGFNKAQDLRPTYYFNGASTVVSLVSFLLWLTASPHRSAPAKQLDKTRRLNLRHSLITPPLVLIAFLPCICTFAHTYACEFV
jgi:hypothetical protein